MLRSETSQRRHALQGLALRAEAYASATSLFMTADEGGERTGDFSKPSALRGLDIAFGLTFTIPSGVRSTPGTTGRGAPLP